MKFAGVCVLFLIGQSFIYSKEKVDFSYQIRPILSKYCFACHGPDKAKGKLRLDDAEGIRKSTKAGKASESELIQRILTDDEDDVMPPHETGKKLKESELALLKQWINEGASFGGHWSFQAIQKPQIPSVKSTKKGITDLDKFVISKLESNKLSPAPEAEKRILIRRLSLDIRGIIPDITEVESFLADNSPDAYEKVVDKFLSSKLYGEKWAAKWLDLARYADTKGYEKDKHREIWRYRDWVIKAINDDMTYDEFTIKQIAGDMLPNTTNDDILATAFHRNTMTNEEGGTDDEEFRTEAVKDRVDTTGMVWMGLSLACAKCHTHKYDPVSIEEYYSLYAFLNQTEDNDREVPMKHMPTAEQKKMFDEVNKQVQELHKQKNTLFARADIQKSFKEWEAEQKKEEEKAGKKGKKGKKKSYFDVHPELIPVAKKIYETEKLLNSYRGSLTPVMVELPESKHRPNYVHERGFFLNKGKKVEAETPAFLHAMDKSLPKNRLGMAKWLVSKENPLTARVAVNRIWAQIFGIGIVETEEDFGNQGTMPSNPELIDYLAVKFMENGWSQKKLIKLILTSSTYKQSSTVSAELAKADKFNIWLARGPRFRMTAEMIRDSSLQAAGLLSDKMYGPSVMPYQPPGLWKSTYNTKTWTTSKGEDKYRRALYTYIKRTSPYPAMTAFDAPSREICTARRIRSNTPLQSLITLNDPVYIEAAQAFARNIIQSDKSFEGRIQHAYKTALSRNAETSEMKALKTLLEERLEFYKKNLSEAALMAENPLGKLAAEKDVPEHAAWTTVCNVILNLDEFLTKE